MPIAASDLLIYGSANMQDTNSGTQGGAISTSKKPWLSQLASNQNIQIVSSSASDTTPTVQCFGMNAVGQTINETKTLNGQTAVAMTTNTTWERLLKMIKSGTTVGDIAVEGATAVRTGTAQGGGAQYIDLDASASASNDAYRDMVIRITGGTGAGQIRTCTQTDQAVAYNGTTKRAYVDRAWGTNPDATSVFRVSYGAVFEKTPNEILEIRQIFYGADADAPGGATRTFYEKIFIKNNHATLTLTAAKIQEAADPSGNVTFGVASSLDDTLTTTDRTTAPVGITFDNADKNVPNSQNHTAGSAIGVWLKLTLAANTPPSKTSYTPRETGQSV